MIDVQNKMVIICENNYKKVLLKKIGYKLLDIKFYTEKEFLEEYLFKIKEEAIYYLIKKYNLKVEIAKVYLNNLYYIKDCDYQDFKLQYLANIKKELIANNLIVYNNNFKKYISDYNIIVIGYSYIDPYLLNIYNEINAKIINSDSKYKCDKVYEFKTMQEEIEYVLNEVSSLILKGININKIKIMGLDKEYYNDFNRLAKFYNIPFKNPIKHSLYSLDITQNFIKNLSLGVKDAIDLLRTKDNVIINKIINICNKYLYVQENNYLQELIIYDLKHTYIDNFNYTNYLEVIDINSYIEDEYVFLMNFGNIKLYKDEEYLTDNIKGEVGLLPSDAKNKLEKEYFINKINSIKNIVLTYKLSDYKKDYYPSHLINELNLEVINYIPKDITYSYMNTLINYGISLDNYYKYGIANDDYYLYLNSIKDIPYQTFNNKFTGINKLELKEYLNNKLTLSYSSLNNYNLCAFRYYIANILKLDKYEENFEAFIGSIFHDVLEKCFNNDLDVSLEINNYIQEKGKILDVKEQFYVNKITNDIKEVINILKEQQNNINLDQALYEKEIIIDKSRDIKVEFKGIIDKLLYKVDLDKTVVAIIDYKTGNVDISLKYAKYGLSLQLPIYLYLVSKSKLFNNPSFAGFYLQYILDKDILRDNNKTYLEQYQDKLKLNGYSNSNIHILSEFDKTYSYSNLIKGLRVKNDGEFTKNSKVLNEEEVNNLINLTENIIDDDIIKILDGDFSINPKQIGYKDKVGCMYCKFYDLCFHTEKDYVILEDTETVLGGEDDA